MNKILLILIPAFLISNEYYYDLKKIFLDEITKTKSYCVRLKEPNSYNCYEYTIRYQQSSRKKNNLTKFNTNMSKLAQDFEEIDIKPDFEVFDYSPSMTSYLHYKIYLISATNKTYSIQKYSESYGAGAAHSLYHTSFYNFSKKDGKLITLKDITLKNKKKEFLKIAKEEFAKEYKEYKNNFFLPKEFFITKDGLVFLYNIYELKSFAEGQTRFLVPFSKLYNIINKEFLNIK